MNTREAPDRCGIPAELPDDTVAMTVGEIEGWLYRIHDPYGRRLQFFLWADSGVWSVTLVDPPLEQGEHDIGLTEQAVIRLREQPPTLLDAFKVSVAWSASMAVAERTRSLCPRPSAHS